MHESDDGWFSYRRRVPAKIQSLIGKSEIKHAYNTKSKVKALRLHAAFHERTQQEFNTALAYLKSVTPLSQSTKHTTPSKLFKDIYAKLNKQGLLPHQIPSLNSTMSELEQLEWSNAHGQYLDAKIRYDAAYIEYYEYKAAVESITFEPFKKFIEHREYITYLEGEEEAFESLPDHGAMTLKILSGDYTSPEPNLTDLFNQYIEFSRVKVANQERNATQQHKLESDVQRLATLVYSAHLDGSKTLINDMDSAAIEQTFNAEYPRTDTRKRNYVQLSAVVNQWNKRNNKNRIDNPFETLIGALPQVDPSKQLRRVWHPQEYQHFWQSIQQEPDPSNRILGMLVAYAGKPQGETKGLLRNDVVLNHEIPHVKFSSNKYRVIGKKRLQHCIPLVGLLLDEFRQYISNFKGGQYDPLFPSLVRKTSGDLSKILNKHKCELYPMPNMLFQPYGLRHTFKPRYKAAQITEINGMYLFGHKTEATSNTHQTYAEGLFKSDEFKSLRDDMNRVMKVDTWDYTYAVSDF